MKNHFLVIGYWVIVLGVLVGERALGMTPQSTQLDTIVAEGRFIMGDNDTRTEARQYAILDAKRKVMEKVGTFLRSYSKTENFVMTQQQIETFSAGFIQTEIIEERTEPVGETMAVVVKIRAIIDPREVRARLAEFQEQPGHAETLAALQQQYQALAAELDSLKQKVSPPSPARSRVKDHPPGEQPQVAPLAMAEERSRNWEEMKKVELLIQLVAESNRRKPDLQRMEELLNRLSAPVAGRDIINGYYGIALFKNGKVREAINYLEKAVRARPEPPPRVKRPRIARMVRDRFQKEQALFHYYLARCYRQIDRPRLAIRHLKMAQRLDPKNPQYRELGLPR
ncbi:MAG: hypothetical protein GXO78_05385 [Calditrichaeota bacterium]|nr:hypothetical protein [Calditrichota bacterium]